ncbi:MAG: peptide chain release factor N(5)-glutamine methyltransferase [Pseudomonadota bacterium]|nr:peptide chain release factor N(5)-glutamine methyltransferase [Pseudomonadota bacterium]
MSSVSDWLNRAQTSLTDSESPRADAELLLMHVLDVNRAWLYTWPEKPLTESQQGSLDTLLARRIEGHPIAHLTGVREFWSLPLRVAPSTLIPRPDTETLIEWVLDLDLPDAARAIDLGTGTGAIALAIKSEYPAWAVEAVEFDADAHALAKNNAERLELDIHVIHGSWFERVTGHFDLIVSNPPYIDPDDHHLTEGDVRFEPASALVAEQSGLADLFHIIDHAPDYLKPDGWLLLEHGYDQAKAVCDYLRQKGFVNVQNRCDLGGNPRISGGQLPGVHE